ncbi:MAG: hypothetical protein WCQ21_28340 [Verrucomicrobiota bacterium]
MKEDQQKFLALLGQLPARLTAEQVAWGLGCQPHDIPHLVTARLLKHLGDPASNGIKYFFAGDILEAMKDRSWLTRVTNTIYAHSQKQNSRKNGGSASGALALSLFPHGNGVAVQAVE